METPRARWHFDGMATAVASIEYPKHFRGIYDEIGARHGHHLAAAMAAIRAQPISEDLRAALAYQTWENPQPSFMLFPLMFLATAEVTGGIRARHLDYLPAIMLFAEMLAVADDTVDRCPRRSNRDTFVRRFGDQSALPFAATLAVMFLQRAHRADQRLFEATAAYLTRFFPLELWEHAHTHPAPELFDSWLEHRYAQGSWSTQLVLDSALLLSDHPPWPTRAIDALNRIGQDADDIVNILEFREDDGENDDLLSGMVTRPMLHTIRARPETGIEIAALWERHRPLAREHLSVPEYQRRRAELVRATLEQYRPIREAIIEHGVPATLADARADLDEAVSETPAHLQELMARLADAFLERACRCEPVEVR